MSDSNRTEKVAKTLTTTFWVVMAIHVAVFVATSSWTLLIIFIPSVVVILIVKQIVIKYARRNPEKERLRRWVLPSKEWKKKQQDIDTNY